MTTDAATSPAWSPGQAAALERVARWLEDPRGGASREPGVFRLFGYAGSGKALAFDQEVQTPDGPRPISVLRPGDLVFGADGKPTRVEGVFPQGPRQAYLVTFRDGASVECDEQHLWAVWTTKLRATGRPPVVRSLREIMDAGVAFDSGIYRFYVPLCEPLEYPHRDDLPLPPYVLGALIGDGTFTSSPTLCLPDEKAGILQRVAAELPEWSFVRTNSQKHCNYHRLLDSRGGPKKPNGVMSAVRHLGLAVNSPRRFIPEPYQVGSASQRLDLLRGLMDTDGSCRGNRTSYSTTSERLADDVRRLVQSLGGTAIKHRRDRGAKGVEFSVNVKMLVCPFDRHGRKKASWSPSKKNPPSRAIVSIAPTRICEHVCIKVAAADGLFLTKDHIVTHNTTLARHLASTVPGVVRYAAFTGKAALVMQSKGCHGASTIHRLIYLPRARCEKHLRELLQRVEAEPDADRRRELQAELAAERENLARPSWTLNVSSSLRDAALLVIDECSMVGEQIGRDLLSFEVPILALGDPAQLPPVKDRGYFTDPRQVPDALLEEVHRQAEGSPVLELATRARQGLALEYGEYEAPGHAASRVVRRRDVPMAEALTFDQVIVGRNATRQALNRLMRQARWGQEVGPLPIPGDRLVCLRNDHEVGLLNGGQWVCLSVEELDDSRLLLAVQEEGGSVAMQVEAHAAYFRGEEPGRWEVRDAQCFDYGYALTGHKAQGSQWRNVCVVDESDSFGVDKWRWVYTCCTRASERVTIVR